jgi:hypothetical protein
VTRRRTLSREMSSSCCGILEPSDERRRGMGNWIRPAKALQGTKPPGVLLQGDPLEIFSGLDYYRSYIGYLASDERRLIIARSAWDRYIDASERRRLSATAHLTGQRHTVVSNSFWTFRNSPSS